MHFNCAVGEDSSETLGLQGDPTSPSLRRSVLGVHWKDWCWSWNSNTLASWCKELTHLKRPWCWERLRAWGEGDDRGEIVGWHHRLMSLGRLIDRETWRAAVHAVAKCRTQLSDWTEPNWMCSVHITTTNSCYLLNAHYFKHFLFTNNSHHLLSFSYVLDPKHIAWMSPHIFL